MNDSDRLKHALGLAASDEPAAVPPLEDLARGRAALRHRSRRRFRMVLTATAVAAVLGAGAGSILHGRGQSDPASVEREEGVELVAMPLDATPYTFDLTPKGWSVQAQLPWSVTIVPDDGSTSSDPNDFIGKLVITFDKNPLSGRTLQHAGHTVWVTTDSGYTIMSMRTGPDEPDGVVRIQYPRNTGWSEPAMVAFLASVHVGPGAEPGLG